MNSKSDQVTVESEGNMQAFHALWQYPQFNLAIKRPTFDFYKGNHNKAYRFYFLNLAILVIPP